MTSAHEVTLGVIQSFSAIGNDSIFLLICFKDPFEHLESCVGIVGWALLLQQLIDFLFYFKGGQTHMVL